MAASGLQRKGGEELGLLASSHGPVMKTAVWVRKGLWAPVVECVTVTFAGAFVLQELALVIRV